MRIKTAWTPLLVAAIAAVGVVAGCDANADLTEPAPAGIAGEMPDTGGSVTEPTDLEAHVTFARRNRFHAAVGRGYAEFDVGGAPGKETYWTASHETPGGVKGRWSADVEIQFDGFLFDVENLYETNCLEVDEGTGEAWIGGVVIESNNPGVIGLPAVLYVRDGGPGKQDFHSILAPEDLPEGVTCEDRPALPFISQVQRGNYFVK